MRRIPLLAALAALALAASAAASPRIIPQPPPRPLGVLVRESQTIHVLQVASVGPKGVSFKVLAALKGKAAAAPFVFVVPLKNAGCEGLFRTGALVLCCREGTVATLHVGGRWVLAVEPIGWRGEKNWFCLAENCYTVIYDGTTEALRTHVVAILTGRQTTVLARTTPGWEGRGGRLWRIKAGPGVTEFVLSDESPHFIGWGTGKAAEVKELAQALRAATVQERIAAAADLAHLGPTARPALPALRRVLRDCDHTVALAAAKALARLDPRADDAVAAVQTRLGHADAAVRSAAAAALAELGPRAAAALPALLRALKDKDQSVRAAAAGAVGPVAASSPRQAVAALAVLLKHEPDEGVWHDAINSLRCLGPHAWVAMPILREALMAPHYGWRSTPHKIIALLTRFDPPPVELLAAVLAEERSRPITRRKVARRLGTLGSRARAALAVLRRVLADPQEDEGVNRTSLRLDAAEAILAIDPDGGPALATPPLLALLKEPSPIRSQALLLLGRCGAVARPSLPALLESLDPEDSGTTSEVEVLTPLLGPKDHELLPIVRQRLSGKRGDPLVLVEVLLRLGRQEEALTQAARCLESNDTHRKVAAARWLAERGRAARAVEPALRRALAKASGAEKTRLALTLSRVCGDKVAGPKARMLAALDGLLAVSCEGEAPGVGPIGRQAFWSWRADYAGWQQDAAVAASVATLHDRLQTDNDPLAVLTKALRDGSSHVRLAAALALARAEPRHAQVVPVLNRLLEHCPDYFRYSADTLVALGPTAAPLATLVQPLLRHPDEDVARAARRVLCRIAPALAAKGWGAAGVPGAVPADLGPLWEDLASTDALRADLAVWRLTGAGPRAVVLLREHLRPPPTPAAERINHLLADLDSRNFAIRQRASTELAEVIEAAAPALRRTLAAAPSLESRRRIEKLLAALDAVPPPEQRRRLRAVRLLEEIGGPDGRALLKSLSRGDRRFALTREAGAALHRLNGR